MSMRWWLIPAALCSLLRAGAARGAEPSAEALLKQYDTIMGAESFEADFAMTARREDGTLHRYRMKVAKAGSDKLRLWFLDPPGVKGQEMMRHGDALYVYMPSLQRSLRVAARDSFQGSDLNNADVLRASYPADYAAALAPHSEVPDTWLLDLQARSAEAAYDHVKLWLRKADGMPVKAEYSTQGGKVLRTAEFSDIRSFNGFKRPSKVAVKNMLAIERSTTLQVESMDTQVRPPAAQFAVESLGH